MVLDSSVPSDQFKLVQRFAREFAQRFDVDSGDARIGVTTYGSSPRTQFYLNRYRNGRDVQSAIDRLRPTGGTPNTASALRSARSYQFTRSYGDRPLANNIMVLVTSKKSRDQRSTQDEAQRLRDSGITVYTIGIDLPETDELEAIASPPGVDNSFNVRSPTEWNQVPNQLVDRVVLCEYPFHDLIFPLLFFSKSKISRYPSYSFICDNLVRK